MDGVRESKFGSKVLLQPQLGLSRSQTIFLAKALPQPSACQGSPPRPFFTSHIWNNASPHRSGPNCFQLALTCSRIPPIQWMNCQLWFWGEFYGLAYRSSRCVLARWVAGFHTPNVFWYTYIYFYKCIHAYTQAYIYIYTCREFQANQIHEKSGRSCWQGIDTWAKTELAICSATSFVHTLAKETVSNCVFHC